MTRCRLLLILSLVYPTVRAANVPANSTSADAEASETAVVELPGARPAPSRRPVTTEPSPVKPPEKTARPETSSIYFPKLIGTWKLGDARRTLGVPLRQRAALDTDKKVSGQIYAFPDPTNRYKEVELEFEQASGPLRAVYLYPTQMTWNDCRRLWGMNVNATLAGKGRTFYSYTNRHLDVLVDPGGKVISLGLY